jgi:hypothetical protein
MHENDNCMTNLNLTHNYRLPESIANRVKEENMKKILVACALAMGVIASAAPAYALDLSGKTVTIRVPFKEGGGSDTLARFLAPFLKEVLPGKPDVIVVNKPGGGGVTGINSWVSSASTDGTDILVGSTSSWVPFVFGAKTVEYDPNNMRAVIGFPRVSVFYTNPERTGVEGPATAETVRRLRDVTLIKGTESPLSYDLGDLAALHMLEIPHIAVFGLGTSDKRNAYLGKEINQNSETLTKYLGILKKDGPGRVSPLFTIGGFDQNGNPIRISELPDVPTFSELYTEVTGELPVGPAYNTMLATHYLRTTLAKSILLPEGTPDDVFDAYVAAFRSLEDNPEYMKGIVADIGARDLVYAEELQRAFRGASGFGAEERAWAEGYMVKTHGVTLD